jgi:emfourin
MRIAFECSGGYANLRLSWVADTEQLPPDVAGDLEREIDDSRIWDIEQPHGDPDAGPPDVFSYLLTVDDGARQRTMAVTDVTAPPSIQPLLSKLRKLALTERGSE